MGGEKEKRDSIRLPLIVFSLHLLVHLVGLRVQFFLQLLLHSFQATHLLTQLRQLQKSILLLMKRHYINCLKRNKCMLESTPPHLVHPSHCA